LTGGGLSPDLCYILIMRRKFAWFCLGVFGLGFAVWLTALLCPDPLTRPSARFSPSIMVLDREGRPLRQLLSPDQSRSRWVPLSAMSPHLIHAALAAEDKRFFFHPGVDPAAVLGALARNLAAWRIVSGGSTITQQLARIILKHHRRGLVNKVVQAFVALGLEAHHPKLEILEHYLNRVPLGNQLFGVKAGCRMYLDKDPARVTPAEAALLMAIPKAPSVFNPYRRPKGLLARRNRILKIMARAGHLSPGALSRALAEPLRLRPLASAFKAPHFVRYVLGQKRFKGQTTIRTSLDLSLQRRIERLVRVHLKRVKARGVTNAAVLVIKNDTGEILAWVGSRNFFDATHAGEVDGVIAPRQPGSALKPFLYGLALESGMSPATILPDLPLTFPTPSGSYIPINYDRLFRGPVRLRVALASSLNVPAVVLAHDVGVGEVLDRLRRLGFASLKHHPDHYGLGLVLGGGEVTLLELTRAFLSLARSGVFQPVRLTPGPAKVKGRRRVFSPFVAFWLSDVLSDDRARAPTFGREGILCLDFPAAVKTGTSKGFRDNWTVGFSRLYTVGVWVGNFSGEPMKKVSGVTGAGPLWREVMELLHQDRLPGPFTPPPGTVMAYICPLSGQLAGPSCPMAVPEYFPADRVPHQTCTLHRKQGRRVVTILPDLYRHWGRATGQDPQDDPPAGETGPSPEHRCPRIIDPRSGDTYAVDPGIPISLQFLVIRACAGRGFNSFEWLVDGRRVKKTARLDDLRWPLRTGRHVFTLVLSGNGRRVEHSVSVNVK
jgi:penicillin-binding protein 1C